MKKTLILLAVLATIRANNINKHLKLLPEIDNSIESDSLPNKVMKKFVAITRKPSDVVFHGPGSIVELTCEGIGVPAPNIRWFRNDAPIYEHNLESNEILETNPTSLARVTSTLLVPNTEDQDRYTCIISSGFKTAKASTTVYSLHGSTDTRSSERTKLGPFAPKILVSYKVFVDTIGNSIVLPCKVRGHPRPKVTWKNNKGIIVSNDWRMKVLRSGELVISSLRWSDMGEFTCRAENAFGSHNTTTFVYPARAE